MTAPTLTLDGPPAQTARVGDLVIVQQSGERLAQLLAIGEHVRVRLWRPGTRCFARPRMLPRTTVVRIAPEDDARVPIARAALRREEGATGQGETEAPAAPAPETKTAATEDAGDRWSTKHTRKGW